MRKLWITVLIISLLFGSAFGAKYAGEAFSLGVGARSLGMGGATIAGPFDGSAVYWNPAGMNYLTGRNIMAMHAETFGSLINHDFVSFSNKLDSGSIFQSYGFYVYYLGGGGIKITDLDVETQRPYVVRESSHGDFLFSGGVSGRYKNKIDYGATFKIIYRDLEAVTGYGFSIDLGGLYQLNESVRLGITATDITSGLIRYSNGTTESIVPTVKPSVLVKHTFGDITGRLVASGDLKFEGIKNGAQYWQGDVSLDTHYGLEGSFREIVFGRFGFDIGSFTAGAGFIFNNISIDMAYLHNSDFDETFRFSAGYTF